MVFKTATIRVRQCLNRYPWIINMLDHRPHWARVLEELHYQQYIDEQTTFDEIDESNAGPLGLSVEEYQDVIEFLNDHDLINFQPDEGETYEELTTDGFQWIRDRQRTQAQAQQNRATSKLTLALLIISAVSFFTLPDVYTWGTTVVFGYIGLTVVYDIIIREY
ncbi:hypothetical protein SAMN05192561_1251 [Halopenitus malekzadehii]|uniref:Uncharacterized protein n=2 Tax=Halopenitus malekzadehii TaxID=1267564 RepID=A0A1H6K526_9EURY|nr:hypothetical protein SAMN05192561_1251 [Halopenitus malekzadehii]